jgi:hypothetical protein
MEFLSSKNIVIILLCIIVVSCLGLGYLEIKNIKSKLTTLENTLLDINKGKGVNNIKNPTNQIINNQKIKNNQKMCIICNRNQVSPSSSLKYHNKYCVNCATIDYNNNIKVQKYMESNKPPIVDKVNDNQILNKTRKDEKKIDSSIEDKEEIEDFRIEDITGEEKEEIVKEEIEEIVKEEIEEIVKEEKEEDIDEFNTDFFNKKISENLTTIKLDILRNLLKENNISHSGNKQIIIGRIVKNNIQTNHLFK